MDNNEVRDAFSEMYGLPTWQVRKGVGSFLTLEFGAPHLRIREPYLSRSESPTTRRLAARRQVTVSGQWHLWIYMCNWTIDANGLRLTDNEASNAAIDRAIRYLDGQKLESVEVMRKDMKTVFQFDLGGKLATWPYADEDVRSDAQWILYDHGAKMTRTLKGDGTWLCESLAD
ncbi:hypothetical protein [Paraburkholderia dipogonis]|uniref:hypothetical protein n=1 Tax=Paraburkholderia dipogonis TaxID=1211383 RepID=UPI0038B93F68